MPVRLISAAVSPDEQPDSLSAQRGSPREWPDVDDLHIAQETFRAAVKRWPGVTLRQGARVIENSRDTRVVSSGDKGREGGR
jgi:hypothetical protein